MSNSTNTRPLRILAIHGYRQNGQVFRQRTGSLRKLLKKHAEFHHVTAPNEVVDNTNESKEAGDLEISDDIGQRGWWFSAENHTFSSKEASNVLVGFEESIDVIDSAFKEFGPFDGLLGFSQGASFVSILCGMQQKGVFQHQFKFAIMISGFKSRCHPHDTYYESKIGIPTLHIYGETDKIIPKEMSEDLLQYFHNPVSTTHEGGHYIPATRKQKDVFINFLEMFLQKNCE